MRKPNIEETQIWHGREVSVKIWCDITSFPWDGDQELEPGAEGWDLYVEISLEHAGQIFTGRASLGSIWVSAGDSIREYRDEVVEEAYDALKTEIQAVIDGRDIKAAKQRAIVARGLFS